MPKDLNFINDFVIELVGKIDSSNPQRLKGFSYQTVIYDHLTSTEPSARKIREYLGNDINLRQLSEILIHPPTSLHKVVSFKNTKNISTTKVFMTRFMNNMNFKNCLKTILYFRGRCCYCNVLVNSERKSSSQATGEHLTPTSSIEQRGTTQYGNVVLCCLKCNNSRDSLILDKWLQQNEPARKRINDFRKFANYQELNKELVQAVNQSIIEIDEKDRSRIINEGKDYRYSSERRIFKQEQVEHHMQKLLKTYEQ